MKLATLLVILLSNNGYWFSGQGGSVNLRSAVKGGLPDADISWELKLKGVVLDHGKVAFPAGDKEVNVSLSVPPTRARLELHWIYRITAKIGGKELETGDVPLHVFADDLTHGLAERVGSKKLVIWDVSNGLPKFLDAAKVHYTRVTAAGSLQFVQADAVLVGPDVLSDSPFEQSPLLNLAKSGASVMIFRQVRPTALIGYPLTLRDTPAKLEWQGDHLLLNGFFPQDLHSWTVGVPTLPVVQLPADEPVSVVGSYPREVPGEQAAPIDAVLMSKSVGKGRLVLCHLPLGDWSKDPRSQMLLNNAVDYLLSRPEPTPRPSERPTARPAEIQPTIPTIQINGDKP